MTALALDLNGNRAIPSRIVTGVEAVRVRLLVRLRTIAGTWITSESKGLPWPDWSGHSTSGRKGVSPEEVSALVREQVELVYGVVSVSRVQSKLTNSVMRITFRVQASEDGEQGALVASAEYDPLRRSGAPPWFIAVVTGTLGAA